MDEFFDFVIEKYSWLIDSYMTRYFVDDLWSKLPVSWQLALQNIEPEECTCLVNASAPSQRIVLPLALLCLKTLVASLPPREAVTSPAAVARSCGIEVETPQDFHNITSANNLRTKLKPKKQYEIDRIVTTVELLRRRNPGQRALLIGLHPCGDLSASILRIFTRSPKVTTMILFGCCYHKLSTVEEEASCSQPHSAYRMQCYRAVLESLITQSHDEEICKQRSSIVVHSVVGRDGITFEEYMRPALAKYPEIVEALEEQLKHDEESRRIIASVDSEWRRFLVVHCLRLILAPIVEQIIIKDRVQYLEECGHSVAVVPLFDPKISPRNFAIIAMKDSVLLIDLLYI
ncbi:hypothetical protein ANCCEY_00415 [Ancylostoma ceylanicum]|uniref:Methyltransferase domain-containing protein n=1 Tax=Ancylostoma ceylanicum TaxID=53326 RepID=A0A0D6MAA0_9BILA|nr:hypothetical protein ANCCEY_00415 [Ancylostoma ceylanicum]